VACLLESGEAAVSFRGSIRLAAYAVIGAPGARLRLFVLHLLDRDTPRRARLVAALAADLGKRLGDGCRVTTGGFERRLYRRDLARVPRLIGGLLHRSTPLVVVQPRAEGDVVEILRFAAERRLAVFPRGVSSSAFGGAVPTRNGIVADFSAMARVLEIDPRGRTVRVEPGVRWADLAARLLPHGLVPVTTPSSRFSTVGGWAATGGLGLESFRYGPLSDALAAARVATAGGLILELRRNDGSLRDFVGTEGQLGLFTELTLRVRESPKASLPRLLYFDGLAPAIEFVEGLAASVCLPSHVLVNDRERMAEENRLFRDRTRLDRPIVEERDAVLLHFDDPAEAARIPAGGEPAGETAARYLWSERFFPLKAQRLGPSLLASEVVLPLAAVVGFADEARAVARRFGSDLSVEMSVARSDRGPEGVVIAAFACDASSGLDYTLRLGLVQLLTRAGVRRGGRPYGVGIWNAPFVRAAVPAKRLKDLARRKCELDPGGLVNPGKFFRVRTRLRNVPGILFGPRANSAALAMLGLASPALGALARVLSRRRPHAGSWRVPAPEEDGGRRLLVESAKRCTFCGACVSTCPAYLLTREELVTGRAKLRLVEALSRGEGVRAAEAHRPFQCFACGLCEEVCQTRLPLVACYEALERWIAERHGHPGELLASFAARADAERASFGDAFGLDLPEWPARGAKA
jgi:FAD/FMN-containing dehydrogenase/NAD-dependent dihydropyrimidine dehydrogenase PreA subunit